MLQLSASLLGKSVMSIRTGGRVATTQSALINPNNLKIEGFYCLDSFSGEVLMLLIQDIREITMQGLIVDDHEVLVEASELIRLKPIIEIGFELINKAVVTSKKEKVGKVTDYSVDNESFIIKKLYVSRSMLKSFSTGQLSIDRTEIVEVTNRKVIIKELLKPAKTGVTATAPAI